MSETVLKVENLNLTYSKGGPQVLFDISFAVDNNDFYAISALNIVLEKDLVKDKNKILEYFNTIWCEYRVTKITTHVHVF